MEAKAAFYGTGRRKGSVARVWLRPGAGQMAVNGKVPDQYFGRATLLLHLLEPLKVTGAENKFDVMATVSGGGLTGQAGAVRLGISRALVAFDAGLRAGLRKAGLLTRDPREKERKKYGQRGARARFQFSKR